MTKSYAPTHTKNSQLCSVSKAFLPYHTKKNYQLFSYWFLLNSCEWSYSINYIVFFPLYFILEGFFIWAVDLCLVWMDGINMKLCVFIVLTWFKPWFWGKLHFLLYQISTMRKENACDQDSNKKSAILVIVLANEKPGHESENETSWGTRYFRLWYKIEAFFCGFLIFIFHYVAFIICFCCCFATQIYIEFILYSQIMAWNL